MNESMGNQKVIDIFENLSPYLQGLGDPVRQRIISLLIDQESMNVSQIAEHVPMSRPTVSHHLKILRQSGLLSVQKKVRRCITSWSSTMRLNYSNSSFISWKWNVRASAYRAGVLHSFSSLFYV